MHNDIVPPNRKRNPYTSNGKPVMSRDLLQRVGAEFDVQTTRGVTPGMTNAASQSLAQRQAIDRRRQRVRRYSDSVIGRTHNMRPSTPSNQGNPTSKTSEVSDTLGNRRPGMAAAKADAPAPPPPPRSVDGFWRRSF